MSFKVEMPKVVFSSVDKSELVSFIPYLVWDKENSEQSTVLIIHSKKAVVWFDEDGYVGHSELDHLMEDRYQVVRQYAPGEQLVVTQR